MLFIEQRVLGAMPRKSLLKFHTLKKPVSSISMNSRALCEMANSGTENPTILVKDQSLQPLSPIHPCRRHQDLLSAEMAGQIDDSWVSSPANQREALDADVR